MDFHGDEKIFDEYRVVCYCGNYSPALDKEHSPVGVVFSNTGYSTKLCPLCGSVAGTDFSFGFAINLRLAQAMEKIKGYGSNSNNWNSP